MPVGGRWIPHAAFAGILIKVAWDMLDVRFLRRLPKLSADIGIVTLRPLLHRGQVAHVCVIVFGQSRGEPWSMGEQPSTIRWKR